METTTFWFFLSRCSSTKLEKIFLSYISILAIAIYPSKLEQDTFTSLITLTENQEFENQLWWERHTFHDKRDSFTIWIGSFLIWKATSPPILAMMLEHFNWWDKLARIPAGLCNRLRRLIYRLIQQGLKSTLFYNHLIWLIYYTFQRKHITIIKYWYIFSIWSH